MKLSLNFVETVSKLTYLTHDTVRFHLQAGRKQTLSKKMALRYKKAFGGELNDWMNCTAPERAALILSSRKYKIQLLRKLRPKVARLETELSQLPGEGGQRGPKTKLTFKFIETVSGLTSISLNTVREHLHGSHCPKAKTAGLYMKAFGGELNDWMMLAGPEMMAIILSSRQYKLHLLKELKAEVAGLETDRAVPGPIKRQRD